MDPHHFGNLDPHPDPHQIDQLDPEPDPADQFDDKSKSMEYKPFFSTFSRI
jgi:hypothetical protein